MKLLYSPTSPFARKVVVCAIVREIEAQIELVATNPHASPPDLVSKNPLSKIPCLITSDGLALFDSPVICEYLDSVDNALPLFPGHGGQRWRALKLQAMADGVMDAAVARRGEQAKPPETARDAFMARQKAAVDRTLAEWEQDPPHSLVDIGTISVGCALGYLDFRFAMEPWREAHPKLAAWFVTFGEHAAMTRTIPA